MRGLLLLCALGCAPRPPTVDFAEIALDRHAGRFMRGEHPFSGIAERRLDGVRVESAGFQDGRRHGWRRHFFADGRVRSETYYRDGRRHGPNRSFWPDGTPRTEGHFDDDAPHGTQRQWYASGALFKEMQLDHGVERGMQRAWRENGTLYNNYEARDGRIYGLRRSKLCFELNDEEVSLAD